MISRDGEEDPMTSELFAVDGTVVFVTGATGGIGRALVEGFAAAGASVVAAGRDEASIGAVVDDLRGRGLDVTPVVLDVADTETAQQVVGSVLNSSGRLDVLVNNAGVKGNQRILDARPESWERTIDINARSVLTLSRLVIERSMRERGGAIINIGSSMSSRAAVMNYQAGGADYCMSKAMVHSITQLLAYEAAPYGIRVNAIAPGIVDTPMHGRPTEETEARHAGRIPMNRIGRPGDVVGPALFLASPGAGYVTGQILHVNGGMLMEP
jgi:NAD(P)-dependent dehydrogenase (short-subunit alcohol dehydrogenase family)